MYPVKPQQAKQAVKPKVLGPYDLYGATPVQPVVPYSYKGTLQRRSQAFANAYRKSRPQTLLDPGINPMIAERIQEEYDLNQNVDNALRTTGQVVGGTAGAIKGAQLGFNMGRAIGAALVLGNAGPQAALPEEIITIPIAIVSTIVMAIAGGHVGAAAGGTLLSRSGHIAAAEIVKDTINNFRESPARGALQGLITMGNTLDQAAGAPIVKSAIVRMQEPDSNMIDLIRQSYGTSEEGLTVMDFSRIRDNAGVDLGSANIAVDFIGELLTDPSLLNLGALLKVTGKGGKQLGKTIASSNDEIIQAFGEGGTRRLSRALIKGDKKAYKDTFFKNTQVRRLLKEDMQVIHKGNSVKSNKFFKFKDFKKVFERLDGRTTDEKISYMINAINKDLPGGVEKLDGRMFKEILLDTSLDETTKIKKIMGQINKEVYKIEQGKLLKSSRVRDLSEFDGAVTNDEYFKALRDSPSGPSVYGDEIVEEYYKQHRQVLLENHNLGKLQEAYARASMVEEYDDILTEISFGITNPAFYAVGSKRIRNLIKKKGLSQKMSDLANFNKRGKAIEVKDLGKGEKVYKLSEATKQATKSLTKEITDKMYDEYQLKKKSQDPEYDKRVQPYVDVHKALEQELSDAEKALREWKKRQRFEYGEVILDDVSEPYFRQEQKKMQEAFDKGRLTAEGIKKLERYNKMLSDRDYWARHNELEEIHAKLLAEVKYIVKVLDNYSKLKYDEFIRLYAGKSIPVKTIKETASAGKKEVETEAYYSDLSPEAQTNLFVNWVSEQKDRPRKDNIIIKDHMTKSESETIQNLNQQVKKLNSEFDNVKYEVRKIQKQIRELESESDISKLPRLERDKIDTQRKINQFNIENAEEVKHALNNVRVARHQVEDLEKAINEQGYKISDAKQSGDKAKVKRLQSEFDRMLDDLETKKRRHEKVQATHNDVYKAEQDKLVELKNLNDTYTRMIPRIKDSDSFKTLRTLREKRKSFEDEAVRIKSTREDIVEVKSSHESDIRSRVDKAQQAKYLAKKRAQFSRIQQGKKHKTMRPVESVGETTQIEYVDFNRLGVSQTRALFKKWLGEQEDFVNYKSYVQTRLEEIQEAVKNMAPNSKGMSDNIKGLEEMLKGLPGFDHLRKTPKESRPDFQMFKDETTLALQGGIRQYLTDPISVGVKEDAENVSVFEVLIKEDGNLNGVTLEDIQKAILKLDDHVNKGMSSSIEEVNNVTSAMVDYLPEDFISMSKTEQLGHLKQVENRWKAIKDTKKRSAGGKNTRYKKPIWKQAFKTDIDSNLAELGIDDFRINTEVGKPTKQQLVASTPDFSYNGVIGRRDRGSLIRDDEAVLEYIENQYPHIKDAFGSDIEDPIEVGQALMHHYSNLRKSRNQQDVLGTSSQEYVLDDITMDEIEEFYRDVLGVENPLDFFNRNLIDQKFNGTTSNVIIRRRELSKREHFSLDNTLKRWRRERRGIVRKVRKKHGKNKSDLILTQNDRYVELEKDIQRLEMLSDRNVEVYTVPEFIKTYGSKEDIEIMEASGDALYFGKNHEATTTMLNIKDRISGTFNKFQQNQNLTTTYNIETMAQAGDLTKLNQALLGDIAGTDGEFAGLAEIIQYLRQSGGLTKDLVGFIKEIEEVNDSVNFAYDLMQHKKFDPENDVGALFDILNATNNEVRYRQLLAKDTVDEITFDRRIGDLRNRLINSGNFEGKEWLIDEVVNGVKLRRADPNKHSNIFFSEPGANYVNHMFDGMTSLIRAMKEGVADLQKDVDSKLIDSQKARDLTDGLVTLRDRMKEEARDFLHINRNVNSNLNNVLFGDEYTHKFFHKDRKGTYHDLASRNSKYVLRRNSTMEANSRFKKAFRDAMYTSDEDSIVDPSTFIKDRPTAVLDGAEGIEYTTYRKVNDTLSNISEGSGIKIGMDSFLKQLKKQRDKKFRNNMDRLINLDIYRQYIRNNPYVEDQVESLVNFMSRNDNMINPTMNDIETVLGAVHRNSTEMASSGELTGIIELVRYYRKLTEERMKQVGVEAGHFDSRKATKAILTAAQYQGDEIVNRLHTQLEGVDFDPAELKDIIANFLKAKDKYNLDTSEGVNQFIKDDAVNNLRELLLKREFTDEQGNVYKETGEWVDGTLKNESYRDRMETSQKNIETAKKHYYEAKEKYIYKFGGYQNFKTGELSRELSGLITQVVKSPNNVEARAMLELFFEEYFGSLDLLDYYIELGKQQNAYKIMQKVQSDGGSLLTVIEKTGYSAEDLRDIYKQHDNTKYSVLNDELLGDINRYDPFEEADADFVKGTEFKKYEEEKDVVESDMTAMDKPVNQRVKDIEKHFTFKFSSVMEWFNRDVDAVYDFFLRNEEYKMVSITNDNRKGTLARASSNYFRVTKKHINGLEKRLEQFKKQLLKTKTPNDKIRIQQHIDEYQDRLNELVEGELALKNGRKAGSNDYDEAVIKQHHDMGYYDDTRPVVSEIIVRNRGDVENMMSNPD